MTTGYTPIETEVTASFVIRWALGGERDSFTMAHVASVYLDEPLTARVSFLTLNVGRAQAGAVHPIALQMSVFPGDDPPAWVGEDSIDPAAAEPQTLVRVDTILPDMRPLWRINLNGTAERVPETHDAVYSFLLDAAAQALDALTTDDPVPVRLLCAADLLGDGVIRFVSPEVNGPWHMRLPSRPPLGSYGSPELGEPFIPNILPTPTVSTNRGASLTLRRLSAWSRRWHLRYGRGEWAEAIVGVEAEFEALVWHFLELILLDHGWKRSDFDHAATHEHGWQVRNTLGALPHHLGGPSSAWADARDGFDKCWDLRNEIVHRSGDASRALVEEARAGAARYITLIEQRLQDPAIARTHPLTSTTILGAERAEQALGPSMAMRARAILHEAPLDLRDLNDNNPRSITAEPLRRNQCWPKV